MNTDSKTKALREYVRVASVYKNKIEKSVLETGKKRKVPLFTPRTVKNYGGTGR